MNTDVRGPDLHLRPATEADAEFAYAVVELTMRAYAEATWCEWQESRVRESMRVAVSDGWSQIIEVNAIPAGILHVIDVPGSHLQLERLFVLPAYQRQGIGTQLLQGVIEDARTRGLPIRLRVLRVNPAKALYERHGFRVTSEEPERFYMEYAP